MSRLVSVQSSINSFMSVVCDIQSFADPITFKYEIPPMVLHENLPNAGVVTVEVAVEVMDEEAVVEIDVVAVEESEVVAVDVNVEVPLSLISAKT